MSKNFFQGPKMPDVDVSGLINSYKKNLESLNQAVGLATETLKTIGQMQTKYFNDSLVELGEVMETLKEGQVQDKFVKAGVAAKASISKALEHSTQVGKVLAKAGQSAAKVLTKSASDIVFDMNKK